MGQIQATRKHMTEVRLNFIKTLDRHTQMEVVSLKFTFVFSSNSVDYIAALRFF